jgi:hypothetical protein
MLQIVLLLSLGLSVSAATTTSVVLTTPSPTISGMVVRVKINGVYVNFAGCNISSFGDLACTSDIGHDVTVTPLESTGIQWWVWILVAVIGLMGAILLAIAVCGYYDKKKNESAPPNNPGYLPVPAYYPGPAVASRVIGVAIERPDLRLPEGPVMA